jgi:hypothetical protein
MLKKSGKLQCTDSAAGRRAAPVRPTPHRQPPSLRPFCSVEAETVRCPNTLLTKFAAKIQQMERLAAWGGGLV